MFGLGMPELIVILIVVMFLFGGKRLPELASGMGKAIRNFKKASLETDEVAVPAIPRGTEGPSAEKENSAANA